MSVYTVHEPPLRAVDDLADPERFVFVRDGFYVWAFLLTPLWLLWRRLWLVLVCYIFFLAVLDVALAIAAASAPVVTLVNVIVSLLIGLEASTLRRFTLHRRGWRNVGIVSGDAEDAERRFFDQWARAKPAPAASPPAGTPSAASPRPPAAPPQTTASEASGIIGLFPEPGAQR
jgi:uncharacterized protein DUF2628